MSSPLQSVTAQCVGRHSPWRIVAVLVFMLFAMSLLLAPRVEAALQMSDDALDMLVGPIALYPDDLVAIVLPASTNPLQLVQADRFLQKRKDNPDTPLDEDWDDAVKALLNYPDIVRRMSDDLDWTSALGEAVVEDQGAVLEGIQSFRRRASAAGNLNSDDKQVVVVEKEVIQIVPADPEIIYVPQYVPSTVIVAGVAPVYGYYPTAYPSYYYPYAPGAALATGIIWGAAMGAIWSGGRYVSHYGGYGGNNNINIDRSVNINTGDINTGNINNSGNRSGNTAWKSNKQPGQVSSSIGKNSPSQRVGDAGGSRSGTGSARASTQPAMDRGGVGVDRAESRGGDFSGGGRDSDFGGGERRSASSGSRGSDAFGGYDSGRQTRADSSRGASSRSSMSGGSRSGGGSRGGGGGRGGGGRR